MKLQERIIEGRLSLILPAHNEQDNLERVVGHCVEVLDRVLPDWEIVVVDDGSRDETPRIADRLAETDPRIRVVHHPCNLGYGSAWRSGFAAARGEFLMCMDSDGQFDIEDITRLLPYVNRYDIVAGYRMERRDPVHRKVNTAIFALAVRLLFHVPLRDLDCAFKIFRARLIHSLPLTETGALINLEIFTLARQRGASYIEVGVNHYPRLAGEPTGAKLSVILRAMVRFLILRVRLWRYSLCSTDGLRFLGGLATGLALASAAQRLLRRR